MRELVALLEERHGLRVDKLTAARIERALAEARATPAQVVASPQLLQRTLDRITLQETSFFRDPPVFADLADRVLPAAIAAAGGGPLVVWSAGCANGQEPWTLAMLLSELGAARFEVVGSDVSAVAVARASAGTYDERELRGLSPARRARFLRREGDRWTITPELRAHVRIVRHNAATEPAPVGSGSCALVLCRYVLIYLTPGAAEALLGNISSALLPEGRLVIGAAESLWHLSDRFTPEALPHAVAYRRRQPGDTTGPRETQRRAQAGAESASTGARAAKAAHRGRTDPPRGGRRSAPTTRHGDTGARTKPTSGAPDAAALVREGEAAAARGDLPAATAAFRGAAFLDPDHALAFAQLGLVLEATGDAGAARAFRSAWAAIDRRDAGALEEELGTYGASALVRLLAEKLGTT